MTPNPIGITNKTIMIVYVKCLGLHESARMSAFKLERKLLPTNGCESNTKDLTLYSADLNQLFACMKSVHHI